MFRKLSLLKIVVIFAISPFAFAKSDILRIGVDLTYPPFRAWITMVIHRGLKSR